MKKENILLVILIPIYFLIIFVLGIYTLIKDIIKKITKYGNKK